MEVRGGASLEEGGGEKERVLDVMPRGYYYNAAVAVNGSGK